MFDGQALSSPRPLKLGQMSIKDYCPFSLSNSRLSRHMRTNTYFETLCTHNATPPRRIRRKIILSQFCHLDELWPGLTKGFLGHSQKRHIVSLGRREPGVRVCNVPRNTSCQPWSIINFNYHGFFRSDCRALHTLSGRFHSGSTPYTTVTVRSFPNYA